MSTGPCGAQPLSRMEAFCEHDIELIAGRKPFPDISAAFFEVADGQVDQLCGGLLGDTGLDTCSEMGLARMVS